jgi:hypothetical protein
MDITNSRAKGKCPLSRHKINQFRLNIELEGLVITRNLLEVSIEHGSFHMLEFSCKKDGYYDFNINFEIQQTQYSYEGQKYCDMRVTGDESNVRPIHIN